MTDKLVTVRLRTNYAGPGLAAQAGDVVRLPEAEAQQLTVGGYADLVAELLGPEAADSFEALTREVRTQEAAASAAARKGGKAKAAKGGEEEAGGLTRTEIEADLTALNVDFDPTVDLASLKAQRDEARAVHQAALVAVAGGAENPDA